VNTSSIGLDALRRQLAIIPQVCHGDLTSDVGRVLNLCRSQAGAGSSANPHRLSSTSSSREHVLNFESDLVSLAQEKRSFNLVPSETGSLQHKGPVHLAGPSAVQRHAQEQHGSVECAQ
jgi:hypothetical protein